MQAPDTAALQRLVTPVGNEMTKASDLASDRRAPTFNHAKAAAEALQSLTWVVYSGPNCGEPGL